MRTDSPAYKAWLSELESMEISISDRTILLNNVITPHDRAYAVQKMFNLHAQKHYHNETIFTAVSIMDRYLAAIGHWNFKASRICVLAVSSILLAAKMEESHAPNFDFMIDLLTNRERLLMTKADLFELEQDILIQLGFELNHPGPIAPLERYLHLLKLDEIVIVKTLAVQLCMFAFNDSSFLEMRPSMLAASACIVSYNIYKRDYEQYKKCGVYAVGGDNTESYFEISTVRNSDGTKLLKLNLTMWSEVATTTGYTVDALRQPIKKLATYMRDNLDPNRLYNFNLE